jgi:hypothetical protein
MFVFLLLVLQCKGEFLMHPPVRSLKYQSCSDFWEKLSIQSQDGCALPLQIVKGPQVAGGVHGSAGWEYMVAKIGWLGTKCSA